MRNLAGIMAFGMVMCLCARLAAEDASWGGDEAKTKELRLTLQNGDVVQGKYSADTKDKIMLTVMTPKGRNMETLRKEDIKKHEWVKPMEDEFRDKLKEFPDDKFEEMQAYAQTMMAKGYKRIYLDFMKDKQKDLTATNFKLYAFLLLNNDCEQEAKDLISWAKGEHPDWKDEIAAAMDRLPQTNKLTDTTGPGATVNIPTVLAPGMMPCSGRVPTSKETNEYWLEDAKKHFPDATKLEFTAFLIYDQPDPTVIVMDCSATYEPKAAGGKGVRYGLGLVYTRRAPGVFAYKDFVVLPWLGFPKPNNN